MRERNRGIRRAAALLALLGVSACGARWNDEQAALVEASFSGDVSVQAPVSEARRAPAGGSDDAGSAATPDTDAGPQPTARVDGGAAGPTPQAREVEAALPCEAPSSEIGVTDRTIVLGAMATRQGPVPGLGDTVAAGARAYVEYQNSIGGICGRTVELRLGDDAFDNGQNRAVVAQLSREVLGFAGSSGIADAGGAEVLEREQVPYTGLVSSTVMADVPSVFSVRPFFRDPRQATAKYRYLHSQGVRRAALVYTAADPARNQMQEQERPQMEAAGIEVVLVREVPLSTLSFDATARAVANSGAEYMLFLSDASYSASMARSMASTQHDLSFLDYITAYGSNFIDLAGDAAEGSIAWIHSIPDEEPGTNESQSRYHEWMSFVAPDLRPDIFSVAAWAGVDVFMQSLRSLDGPITRESIVTALGSIESYDAGGLIAPVPFGAKDSRGCVIGVRVVEASWQRLTPAEGFAC